MILAELIRRGRGERILIVTPRHVLEQMQHEMPAATRPASQATWSPGHQAIEQHDLLQLRQILDACHDIEDETQDGLTLLRHAVRRDGVRARRISDPSTGTGTRRADPVDAGEQLADAFATSHWPKTAASTR